MIPDYVGCFIEAELSVAGLMELKGEKVGLDDGLVRIHNPLQFIAVLCRTFAEPRLTTIYC